VVDDIRNNVFPSGIKYEKLDHQGRAALYERNPNTTQQHTTTGKEPSRTPNKNRTGHKAKHGRCIYSIQA
jgi:hypothetical protein